RQVLRAQARRLHRLHADDRDPHAAAARPVRQECRAMSAGVPLAERTARAGEASAGKVAKALAASSAWRWWEIALGVAAVGSWWLLADHALLLNEIAILALFALSLDLILGYAGVVSLG